MPRRRSWQKNETARRHRLRVFLHNAAGLPPTAPSGVGPSCPPSRSGTFSPFHPLTPALSQREREKCPQPVPHARRPTPAPFAPFHPSPRPSPKGRGRNARRLSLMPAAPLRHLLPLSTPHPGPLPKGEGEMPAACPSCPSSLSCSSLLSYPLPPLSFPLPPHCHSRSFKRESSILSFPARGGCSPRPSTSPLATDHYPLVRQQRQINVHADAGENRAARGAVE